MVNIIVDMPVIYLFVNCCKKVGCIGDKAASGALWLAVLLTVSLTGCIAGQPLGSSQAPSDRLDNSSLQEPSKRDTDGAPAVKQKGETTLEPYKETLSGTLVSFEMMPVGAGQITLKTEEGSREVQVEPFWISKTEVSWDTYDVFVYSLDDNKDVSAEEADAFARPTKPYVLPGESFGHEGRPALGMTHHMAQQFVKWLSAKTGHTYRLATEAEWEYACRTGMMEGGDAHQVQTHAWYQENSEAQTHKVTSLKPNGLGVYHMLGNVAEWVTVPDGEPVVKGGSFNSAADELACSTRAKQQPSWNASDPQIPKSESWLPDATFVGMRIVRVPEN